MTQKEYDQLMAGGFCAYPFHNIRNSSTRGYIPCCWSRKIKDPITGEKDETYRRDPINATPIKGWFDGDYQTHIRRAMLAGDVDDSLLGFMCSRCKEREIGTGTSPRLMKTTKKLAELITSSFDDTGKIKNRNHRFLSLQLNIWGLPCNLECIGCNPADSTTRYNRVKSLSVETVGMLVNKELSFFEKSLDLVDIKKRDKNQFYNIIEEIVDNIDIVSHISLCGGEPMLMTNHFELLDAIIASGHAKHISLDYVSNMTLFTLKKMKKYIDAFKSIDIQWSIDGIGSVNNYLRYPTNWDSTLENVRLIREYFSSTGKGILRATFTPSNLSILSMKETFEFLESEGLKVRDVNGQFEVYNRLENPKILRPNNLPVAIKDKIKNDIRSINESVYYDLIEESGIGKWEELKSYLDDLDASRGTSWRDIFPLLANY
jgi:sulfatase maturation enzyme AslB (radical SAM superfamily)